MEQFVKMLHDRLETKKELQLQLYVIMQNAINEMHNNGIIASLTGDAANAVHDPNPEVRVREKTSLAKSVGKQFIPTTMPVPSQGGLSYLANLNYDPRFVNSITLCFQGGIEGLHMPFANVVMCDGKLIYGEMNNTQEKANTDKPLVKDEPKKGFFAKLFGKK